MLVLLTKIINLATQVIDYTFIQSNSLTAFLTNRSHCYKRE